MKGLPAEAIGYSDFIVSGKWNVDDVLRPIYQEASEAVGREFPYPDQ
jgi:ribonuclease Z